MTDAIIEDDRYNLHQQAALSWCDRASIAARMIANIAPSDSPFRIADVGCGDCKLQFALQQLELDFIYDAFDLLPQFKHVTQINIASASLPLSYAVVALLGVIEYLDDVENVLERIAGSSRFMVFSHACKKDPPYTLEEISTLGWRFSHQEDEVDKMARRLGLSILDKAVTKNAKTIIWLCKSSASELAL